MSPRRSAPILTGAALACGALGLWLSTVVFASDERPAFAFPDDGGDLLPAAAAGDATPAPAAGAPPKLAGSVEVRVSPKARYLRPGATPSAPCRLFVGREPIPARATWLAGPRSGRPDAPLPGRHLVRFVLPDGSGVCRLVAADREDVVDVVLGAPREVRGRVLAAGDGAPVAGAEVWFGALAADGSRVVSTTDGRGEFVGEAAAGDGVPLTVRAPGFASAWLAVHADGRGAVDVRLEPAAELRVALAAKVRDAAAGSVWVLPAGETRTVGITRYPFFLAALDGPAKLKRDGPAVLDDLPRGAAVAVAVIHPEAPTRRTVASARSLGARPTTVVVPVPAGDVLEGRVVARGGGRPIPGAVVEHFEPGRGVSAPGDLLPCAVLCRGASVAVTDAAGRFRLGLLRAAGRRARLLVRAPGHFGVEVDLGRPRSGDRGRGETVFALPPAAWPRAADAAGPGETRGDTIGPALHLRATTPRDRLLRVSIQQAADRGVWRTWRDDESFVQELNDYALVDVSVTVELADGTRRQLPMLEDVAVLGVVELPIDV